EAVAAVVQQHADVAGYLVGRHHVQAVDPVEIDQRQGGRPVADGDDDRPGETASPQAGEDGHRPVPRVVRHEVAAAVAVQVGGGEADRQAARGGALHGWAGGGG